jgi:hypothetical protein
VGEAVDLRQLVLENLLEPRYQVDLQPAAVLEDRVLPAVAGVPGRAVLELEEVLDDDTGVVEDGAALDIANPSTSRIRFSRSSWSKRRLHSSSAWRSAQT